MSKPGKPDHHLWANQVRKLGCICHDSRSHLRLESRAGTARLTPPRLSQGAHVCALTRINLWFSAMSKTGLVLPQYVPGHSVSVRRCDLWPPMSKYSVVLLLRVKARLGSDNEPVHHQCCRCHCTVMLFGVLGEESLQTVAGFYKSLLFLGSGVAGVGGFPVT